MPRQKTITLYKYNELPTEEAKEKAREWFATDYPDYGWWDHMYEDAERIGLKITGFDLGRSQDIDGHLEVSVEECCKRIMADHGKDCETYKLAERWVLAPGATEDEDEEEAAKKVFTQELLEEYFTLLNKEYEWLLSKEQIEETIVANEYEFLENGKRA